jgi:hypothetical protein
MCAVESIVGSSAPCLTCRAIACSLRSLKKPAFRRHVLPAYQGGRPPEYGRRVRPLARVWKGRFIPATPPDRVETWTDDRMEFRAEFWDHLVLPHVKFQSLARCQSDFGKRRLSSTTCPRASWAIGAPNRPSAPENAVRRSMTRRFPDLEAALTASGNPRLGTAAYRWWAVYRKLKSSASWQIAHAVAHANGATSLPLPCAG